MQSETLNILHIRLLLTIFFWVLSYYSIDKNGKFAAYKPFLKSLMCINNQAKWLRVDLLLKIEFNTVNRLRREEIARLQAFHQSVAIMSPPLLKQTRKSSLLIPKACTSRGRSEKDAVIGVLLLHLFVRDLLGRYSLASAVYQREVDTE